MIDTITDKKLGPLELVTSGKFYHLIHVRVNGIGLEIYSAPTTLCGEPLNTSDPTATTCCPDCDRIAKGSPIPRTDR